MTCNFHGQFSSSDASGLTESNSRIALYAPGATSALTLNANDQVFVKDITITTGASLTVTLYDGADATVDAGEKIQYVIINGTACPSLAIPHQCKNGTWPKVKTNASGQVDVVIHGAIYRKGD